MNVRGDLMKKKGARIASMDIVKGLCIILVIIGHSGIKVPFVPIFWYSFYMSAFFLFSGYLFNYKDTVRKTVIYKIKSMYLLYLMWAIIPYSILGIIRIISGKLAIIDFTKIIGKIVLGIKCPSEVAQLWFICALFTVEILWIIIDKLFKTRKSKIIFSALLFTIGIVLNVLGIKRTFFRIDNALMLLPIFELGVLYQRNKENKIMNNFVYMKIPVLLCLTIIHILLVILNCHVLKYGISIAGGQYGLYPLFYINAILGTLVALNYARIIHEKSKNIIKKVSEYFMFIGQNSTITYITMNILIFLIRYVLKNVFSLNKAMMPKVVFLIMLCIQIPLIKLLKKEKLKFLLAKF